VERINLGDKAKDTITGLDGIVIAVTEWLYGCRRLTIQPQKPKDGVALQNFTIDEPQAKLIKAGAFKPFTHRAPEAPVRRHGNRPDVGAPQATPPSR
jgi:hypothetical protein